MQHPDLLNNEYQPSEFVFGNIEDGKPWWGILGHCFYGDGEKSIEGPSEESRFIANPFLLVGLKDIYAHRVKSPVLTPKEIYPKPNNLVWALERKIAKVEYDISSFWQEGRKYGYPFLDGDLDLAAYNAKDLGFNYLYVSLKDSKNIKSLNKTKHALEIPFFLHCGNSSGYPGGCNNASPSAPDFRIRIVQVPALAMIKLWREKPKNIEQIPDMIFYIKIK